MLSRLLIYHVHVLHEFVFLYAVTQRKVAVTQCTFFIQNLKIFPMFSGNEIQW